MVLTPHTTGLFQAPIQRQPIDGRKAEDLIMLTNLRRDAMRSMRIIGFAVLALVTAAAFDVQPASANVELVLDPKVVRLGNALKEMQWQDELTASDEEKVMEGLNSKSHWVVGHAVDVVALHRLAAAAPLLEKMAAPYEIELGEESSIVADLIVKAFRSGRDPVASMRDLLVEDRLPTSWMVGGSDYISAKERMVSIVATDEAKRLRKGGVPDAKLAQVKLNSYGDKLLHYSKMKPEAAIDDIFEQLRNITRASMK